MSRRLTEAIDVRKLRDKRTQMVVPVFTPGRTSTINFVHGLVAEVSRVLLPAFIDLHFFEDLREARSSFRKLANINIR